MPVLAAFLLYAYLCQAESGSSPQNVNHQNNSLVHTGDNTTTDHPLHGEEILDFMHEVFDSSTAAMWLDEMDDSINNNTQSRPLTSVNRADVEKSTRSHLMDQTSDDLEGSTVVTEVDFERTTKSPMEDIHGTNETPLGEMHNAGEDLGVNFLNTTNIAVTHMKTGYMPTITTSEEMQNSIILKMSHYTYLLFLLAGIPLNGMSFAVFFHRFKAHRCAANIYFMALAVADSISVTTGSLVNFCASLNPPVYLPWLSGCNVLFIPLFAGSQLSSLILTIITIDRFLATYFPLKFHYWSSWKKAVGIVSSLTFAVIALNWQGMGGLEPIPADQLANTSVYHHCRGKTPFIDYYMFEVSLWIGEGLYFFIPGILIVIFNSLIIVKVRLSIRADRKSVV
jgi:hypothetical protein